MKLACTRESFHRLVQDGHKDLLGLIDRMSIGGVRGGRHQEAVSSLLLQCSSEGAIIA